MAHDIIYLRELRVNTIIGIHAWERRVRQTLCIDLEMAADIEKAAVSDAIDDTLNYQAVAERVTAYAEKSRFNLIETLAERVAGILQKEFKIPWMRVKVSKPGAIPSARAVGVTIERGTRTA
jgi:dihydroneopterin aldolase